MLDFGEGLFDRIEIGRVGRQEPEPCAGRLNGLPNGGGFVAAQIVHDDDVARPQHRNKLLMHIGAEARAIDRAVEDTRRGQSVAAQCAEESHGAPMAMRGKAAQPLPFRAPAAQRGHVGLYPGLVDEDQTRRIEPTLPGFPALAAPGNVGAALLKGEQRFF
jgi:hypothetical protein